MTWVAVALGANLGDRLAALEAAVGGLATLLSDLRVSSVYETDPVGGPEGQPPFLNAVAVGQTELAPADLLAGLHRIEAAQGRVRDVRWGPRTLDLDLLAYGGVRSDEPSLTLPHPRAHLRAFVLLPWAEVAPADLLPGHGRVADLAAGLPARESAGVRRRVDLAVSPPGPS